MNHVVLGGLVAACGVFIVLVRHPLAVLQVKSQPRWMHPWKNPVEVSESIILVVGLGLLVSGILTIVNP